MDPELSGRLSSIIRQADAFTASGENPGLPGRFDFILSRWLGLVYKAGPLGEGAGADFDPKPLIDLDAVDCVTFIEQGLAIALSREPGDVPALLAKIRYNKGEVSYLTRNHYFSADWIPANSWLLNDVTGSLAAGNAVEVTKKIDKRRFFEEKGYPVQSGMSGSASPGILTVSTMIIPPEHLSRTDPLINTGDILPVTIGAAGIIVRHVGEAVRDAGGRLLLRHASSRSRRVIQEPFDDYLRTFTPPAGFKVLRLAEQPQHFGSAGQAPFR